MKLTCKRTALAAAVGTALLTASAASTAALQEDLVEGEVVPEWIVDNGGSNGGFTVERTGVETTRGTVRVEVGVRVVDGACEWSINTAWQNRSEAIEDSSVTSSSEDEILTDELAWNLDDLTYQLDLPDGTSGDPVQDGSGIWIGDNSTGPNAGMQAGPIEGEDVNVAQNSNSASCAGNQPFTLTAFDPEGGEIASVTLSGSATPAPRPIPLLGPWTLVLLGVGLGGLGAARARKRA